VGGASHATSILAVNGESSGRAQLDAVGALSPHRPTEHVRLHRGTVTIIRLAHYAIHTSDLEASRRFYTEVMGFRVGYRPSFPFPGIWLYQHEEQSEFGIVHIIGLDPDDPKNLEGYRGIGSNKPRSGTDSFDHIAFLAKDWPQMRTPLPSSSGRLCGAKCTRARSAPGLSGRPFRDHTRTELSRD